MYGHTLGGAVGLGYVSDSGGVNEEFIRTGRFEILIGDSRVSTRASLRPFYDPASARPRK
jgi:4-methylaminobutanoate oxidase (formaldehyde-forming)